MNERPAEASPGADLFPLIDRLDRLDRLEELLEMMDELGVTTRAEAERQLTELEAQVGDEEGGS